MRNTITIISIIAGIFIWSYFSGYLPASKWAKGKHILIEKQLGGDVVKTYKSGSIYSPFSLIKPYPDMVLYYLPYFNRSLDEDNNVVVYGVFIRDLEGYRVRVFQFKCGSKIGKSLEFKNFDSFFEYGLDSLTNEELLSKLNQEIDDTDMGVYYDIKNLICNKRSQMIEK